MVAAAASLHEVALSEAEAWLRAAVGAEVDRIRCALVRSRPTATEVVAGATDFIDDMMVQGIRLRPLAEAFSAALSALGLRVGYGTFRNVRSRVGRLVGAGARERVAGRDGVDHPHMRRARVSGRTDPLPEPLLERVLEVVGFCGRGAGKGVLDATRRLFEGMRQAVLGGAYAAIHGAVSGVRPGARRQAVFASRSPLAAGVVPPAPVAAALSGPVRQGAGTALQSMSADELRAAAKAEEDAEYERHLDIMDEERARRAAAAAASGGR